MIIWQQKHAIEYTSRSPSQGWVTRNRGLPRYNKLIHMWSCNSAVHTDFHPDTPDIFCYLWRCALKICECKQWAPVNVSNAKSHPANSNTRSSKVKCRKIGDEPSPWQGPCDYSKFGYPQCQRPDFPIVFVTFGQCLLYTTTRAEVCPVCSKQDDYLNDTHKVKWRITTLTMNPFPDWAHANTINSKFSNKNTQIFRLFLS